MRRRINLKLLVITVGTLLILAVIVHLVHQYQLRQNAYRLLEQGDRALQTQDYEKAESYYAQYLEFVPGDADTAQKYAQVLDQQTGQGGDRVQLVLRMEQVLRVKPNEHAFRLRLVQNLILLDRISEAMEHLKKMMGQADNPAELQHMLGWCQEAKKEYGLAAASFREAIRLRPQQIKSYALLTEVLQERLNQPEEALKVMNDMVEANKDAARAFLLRARFQRRRGEEKEADSDLQRALQLGPRQPAVILEAAEVARQRGKIDEAVQLLQESSRRDPDNPDFYKALANLKIQTGHRAEAIAHLQEGLRRSPRSTELAVLYIDLLIDQKQHGDAGKKIQELLDAGLKPTLPNYLTARLRIADRQWNEAIQLLEGVQKDLGPSSEWTSRVQVMLGLCYRQIGDHEQELLAFRRAVNEESGWMLANLELATALLSRGRVDEAANLLEPLSTAKEVPASYWLLLARVRLEQQQRSTEAEPAWEKIEQALARAAQAAATTPEAPAQPGVEVELMRAEMLAARKDYAAAQTLLKQCQEKYPQEVQVWCALADLAVRQDQWAQAEALLEQAAAPNGLSTRIEWQLAKVRLWSRHGTPADLDKLAQLSDAVHREGVVAERMRLRRELAQAWYQLGRWERAERFWREIAQELPRDLPSRCGLLEMDLEKNDPRSARRWRDEIRVIEGDAGTHGRYATAAILVQESQGERSKLQEARKLLQELEQQNGARAAALSATIFEMEGQYQDAIRAYTRALELGDLQPRRMARLLELLLERREYGKAESALARYEQKLPLTRDLARLGAEVAVGMRDKSYARVALRRGEAAVTLPSRDYRELLWLAHICQAAGENARAETLLREGVTIAGHTPDTWIALAEHLAQTDQGQAAQALLDRLRRELPRERQPLTLARCHEGMHRPAEADRAYQQALKEQPNDFAVLACAADFYRRAERVEEAKKWYARLLEPALAAPAEFTVKARRQLAILLAQPGDAAACRQALALVEDNRRSRGATVTDERIRLFILSQAAPERQPALSKFQDTLPQQQPTPEERLLLAQMLEASDHLGQARSHLSEVVDQYPSVPLFLVRCVRVLIKTGELDEAQRLVTQLETLEPDSPRVRAVKSALSRALDKASTSTP